MSIENTIPVLGVADMDRAMAFYRDQLGFEVEWSADTTCGLARDGWRLMLSSNAPAAMVWVGLHDDKLMQRAIDVGMEVVQSPTNNPWAYEAKVRDVDGNVLWFGTEPR